MKSEKQTLKDLGMTEEQVEELEQDTNDYLESVYDGCSEEETE